LQFSPSESAKLKSLAARWCVTSMGPISTTAGLRVRAGAPR
jgi:hypothetical protein